MVSVMSVNIPILLLSLTIIILGSAVSNTSSASYIWHTYLNIILNVRYVCLCLYVYICIYIPSLLWELVLVTAKSCLYLIILLCSSYVPALYQLRAAMIVARTQSDSVFITSTCLVTPQALQLYLRYSFP